MRKYDRKFLISEVLRYIKNNDKIPRQKDMCIKFGYPSYNYYITEFGSWVNVLKELNIVRGNKYTNEFLISELHRFVKEYNKIPKSHDLIATHGYPSYQTYVNYFGGWNKSLKTANLFVASSSGSVNDRCGICGGVPSHSGQWYNINYTKICNNCYQRNRNHILGTLDPESNVGMGIITEYITAQVLTNVIMCNTKHAFKSSVDLISDKYGTINVKSATLRRYNKRKCTYWGFRTGHVVVIPDYYIAIGFNMNKSSIEKVWIIPSDANIISKSGICLTNSLNGLSRAIQYEVDVTPYNEVYKNLDIYSIPAFCNFPKPTECEV